MTIGIAFIASAAMGLSTLGDPSVTDIDMKDKLCRLYINVNTSIAVSFPTSFMD